MLGDRPREVRRPTVGARACSETARAQLCGQPRHSSATASPAATTAAVPHSAARPVALGRCGFRRACDRPARMRSESAVHEGGRGVGAGQMVHGQLLRHVGADLDRRCCSCSPQRPDAASRGAHAVQSVGRLSGPGDRLDGDRSRSCPGTGAR